MKLIFGSGIVGLMARFLLGPEWTVVPFYKSRFFSFNPALDDNFIIRDPRLDDFIKDLTKSDVKLHLYARYWSASGHVVKTFDNTLYESWVYKIFGNSVPSHSKAYFSNRMNLSIYDTKVNQLYASLVSMYVDELKAESNKGKVTEIGDHYIVRNGNRVDFDDAISTIPLDALYSLMRKSHNLSAKTIHYLHVKTDNLDFEGANQMLVADGNIDFFKVSNISPGRYLFYCHNDIQHPGVYLMQFMQQFDIIDGTSIQGVIPIGNMEPIEFLSSNGIYCIGSSAQWDWCMDVGSCAIRLIEYAQSRKIPTTLLR